MEVMNGAEFKQQQVIIGQQTKTKGFSVSDDPMLMSILSTGLYQNPLKSMIQEAVFNAWDAHKASGRMDQPIEIIITDDNQLIISDSGYGIAPEDMYEIYCVYGASTKRDDNDQTGGFGLGCKAPFAYTDSFRVTSSHKGKRYLYLVSRANDDNDGKPGITEMVGNIDCLDSGLMVSIPLKDDRDARKAYEVLKTKIFPYSGINWTLTFKEEEPEAEQEDELLPGQFVLEGGRMDQHEDLTAQYGGVAYNVPYSEEYETEYNFLSNTIGAVGSIRAGFDSGTLTPLPSREGLNLSETTVKNLRVQIQTIIDELNVLLHPMMDLAINWVAHCIGERDESLYDTDRNNYYHSPTPFERFNGAGFRQDFDDILSRDQMAMYLDQPIPEGQNEELVMRLREVIMQHTRKIVRGVGADWFVRRRAIAWSVQNGHDRERFDILMKRDDTNGTLVSRLNQRTIEKTIRALLQVSAHVDINPHLRVRVRGECQSSRFTPVAEENEPSSYSKLNKYNEAKKAKRHLPTKRLTLDTLRATQSRRSPPKNFDTSTIVLAHTIKDGNYYNEADAGYQNQKIPVFVIGTSVAKMKKAETFLKNQGYNVLVAPKYVEPKLTDDMLESVASAPVFEGWPLLDPYEEGFASTYNMCKEPTMYILYSKTRYQKENGYYRNRNKFDHNAVHALRSFFSNEKIVVINHPNKLRALKKMGVVAVNERIDEMVRKILADPEFTKKLAMHQHAESHGTVPDTLLQIPEFTKLLGLPYIRTKELVNFRRAKELLDHIAECDSDVFCSNGTRELIRKHMTVDSTSVSRSSAILLSLDILDPRVLKDRLNGMSDGEKKVYAEKLARFIRTTTT